MRPGHHRGGHGEPLVLLHGIGGSWQAWAPVLELLEDRHDVFAPTLPGHVGGEELDLTQPPTVADLADAVADLLDREGLERPHVVGNSLGGWLALELARRGRARSVVGLSPGGAWGSALAVGAAIGLLRAANGVFRHVDGQLDWLIRRPQGRRLLLRTAMSRGDRLSPADVKQLLRDTAECPVLLPLLSTVVDSPMEPLPADLGIPIRLAWGEEDRLLPAGRFAGPVLERVPQAELLMLPHVGHVPMADDPQLVARTILEVTLR